MKNDVNDIIVNLSILLLKIIEKMYILLSIGCFFFL